MAQTIRAAAAETVRAAMAAVGDASPADAAPGPRGKSRGQSNVVVATNVGQPGATTGAFVEQTADATRQGVLTDDGWHVTEQTHNQD
jgi:hypothetical protein